MKPLPCPPRMRALARAAASLPLCLALALALALAPGLPAQAQNLCASQASQVNPMAAAPSGVGGTGAPASGLAHVLKGWWQTARGRLAGPARDGTGGMGGTGAVAGRPGLGGTGISEGGIGGTGIVGVITGFASICVNGVEVHFDAATPVSDNGQPGSARQLAVGQVVAVRAAGAGAEVSARKIAVIHAAVGPLDAPDVETGAFRILGQTARALDPKELSGLRAGDWVRVSGHRLAQGEIAASRVEPIAVLPQVQLNGTVDSIDADTITVNGSRVRLGAQPPPAGLAPGREVLLSGGWDGSTLQAERLQLDPTRAGLGPVERVVLEGYVQALDKRELSLGLGPLTLSPDLQIVGGSAAELAVNRRVQVSGRVGADQRVTVDRLEFSKGGAGSDGGSSSGRSGSQRGSDSSGKGSSDDSGSSGKGSSSGSGSSGSGGSGSGGSGGGGGGGSSGGGSGGGGGGGGGGSGGSGGGSGK